MSEYSDVITREDIVRVSSILRKFNKKCDNLILNKSGLYGGIDKNSNDFCSDQFDFGTSQFVSKNQVLCAKEIIGELSKSSGSGYCIKRVEISSEILYFTDMISSFNDIVYGSVEGDNKLDDSVGDVVRISANYLLSEFVPINLEYNWKPIKMSTKLARLINMVNYTFGSGIFHLAGDNNPYIVNYELGISCRDKGVVNNIVAAVIDIFGLNVKEVYFIFKENVDKSNNIKASKRLNGDSELTITLCSI